MGEIKEKVKDRGNTRCAVISSKATAERVFIVSLRTARRREKRQNKTRARERVKARIKMARARRVKTVKARRVKMARVKTARARIKAKIKVRIRIKVREEARRQLRRWSFGDLELRLERHLAVLNLERHLALTRRGAYLQRHLECRVELLERQVECARHRGWLELLAR